MLAYARQTIGLLDAADKRRLFAILLLSTIAAVVHAVSVLSVMPFIILLAEPSILESNALMSRLYAYVEADSYQQFLVLFGIFGIVVLSIGNLFLAIENWISHRFVCMLGHGLEKRVFRIILQQRYEYFVGRHTATLTNVILEQVPRVVDGVIGALIAVFTNMILVLLIVVILMLVSVKTTLITLTGLVIVYFAIFMLVRNRVKSHGQELTHLSESVLRTVKETLDAIVEIKLRIAENFFSSRFEKTSLQLSRLNVRHNVLQFLPNFALETVIFAGLVLMALYLLSVTQSSGLTLSIVALYGMATYRLIPALRTVFEGISTVNYNADALRLVSEHLRLDEALPTQIELPGFSQDIRLARVRYRYPGSSEYQLDDVTLAIPAGSTICLFGPSGSGKSTILSILAGLILPTDGQFEIDGQAIAPESLNSWRRKIGFVPQRLHLMDDSVANNIAFGIDAGVVDDDRVIAAGKMSGIHAFVTAEMPNGYSTRIGENGKNLSGGQRQRLGIARALYCKPEILIFDESFSGIDAETKKEILQRVLSMRDRTIIFSTHEEEIAAVCQQVYLIESGKVTASGRFDELARGNSRFAAMLASSVGSTPDSASRRGTS